MTKAKARERAKAKAAQKIKKRQDGADQATQNVPPGRFDPKANSISSPGATASGRNTGGARRGAARSR